MADSRIGFAYQCQPLDAEDIPTVLAQHGDQLGQAFDPSNTDQAETVNAVKQITVGNFRLIERLMTQIARVMAINQTHLRPSPPTSFMPLWAEGRIPEASERFQPVKRQLLPLVPLSGSRFGIRVEPR